MRVARRGRFQHDRAKKEPGSVFLGRFLIEFGYWLFSPLEKLMHALHVTPNQLTAASLIASLAGAAAFAAGQPAWGGVLVLVCAILDALDGMVARSRGTASDAGELIDAAVDRYAEIATFAGIAAYYRHQPLGFWLSLTSLGGALLVSYARAKGEISGIDARMGSMNRGERALYVGLAGMVAPDVARWLEPGAAHPQFHALLFVLGLVAVLANITAVRRFLFIYQELRKRDAKAGEPDPAHSAAERMKGWFGRAWVAAAAATLVDYGTFAVLVQGVGAYPGTSTATGAFFGAITNFVINRLWTFKSRENSLWVEVPRYAAISLTSLLLNTGGVILLVDGLKWNPMLGRILVGVLVSLCWNLPLHRYFVFRELSHKQPRPALSIVGAAASALGSVAVLSMAYGSPFADTAVHGFSNQLPDTATVTQKSFLPKLRPEAFYSESYSFLFAVEDGSFARVQFLVSNGGLVGHGKAAVRAVVVHPDGAIVEDGEGFDADGWSVKPEGAIEMGPNRLTMGPDASHHVHFAGKKLVIDATVLPETRAVRPGGGQIVFDTSGHALFDETIFALRSRFSGTIWSPANGARKAAGTCYADTNFSTVAPSKSASLWIRMVAFEDPPADAAGRAGDGTAAMAVLFPPEGSPLAEQGWLYTSRAGQTDLRASGVRLTLSDLQLERSSRSAREVPRRIAGVATGAHGEKITIALERKRPLYVEDGLDELGPVARLVASAMGAPVSYTVEHRYTLRVERPGQAPEEQQGVALVEFRFTGDAKVNKL